MKKEHGSTKICKHCKTEIDYYAKICSQCKKKQGMGIIPKVIIGAVALFVIIGLFGGGDDKSQIDNLENETIEVSNTVEPVGEISEEITEEEPAEEVEIKTEEPKEEVPVVETQESTNESDPMTLGQKNALSKAAQYLDYTAFSHSGLIEQLVYEGFSDEEATFAADNCGADWNEQAAMKAAQYLDYSSFSRSGLIEQLEFEGFSSEQAGYGATSVGY